MEHTSIIKPNKSPATKNKKAGQTSQTQNNGPKQLQLLTIIVRHHRFEKPRQISTILTRILRHRFALDQAIFQIGFAGDLQRQVFQSQSCSVKDGPTRSQGRFGRPHPLDVDVCQGKTTVSIGSPGHDQWLLGRGKDKSILNLVSTSVEEV